MEPVVVKFVKILLQSIGDWMEKSYRLQKGVSSSQFGRHHMETTVICSGNLSKSIETCQMFHAT